MSDDVMRVAQSVGFIRTGLQKIEDKLDVIDERSRSFEVNLATLTERVDTIRANQRVIQEHIAGAPPGRVRPSNAAMTLSGSIGAAVAVAVKTLYDLFAK